MTARLLAIATALVLSSPVLAATSTQPNPQSNPQSSGQPEEKVDKQKMHEAEQRLTDAFKGQPNFQISGTLLAADPDHGSVVVQRNSLPIAFLIVPETAPITLDGKKSSLADLKPGAEVRATFNLVQQYPIALQVDAKHGAPPSAVPAPQK